MDTLIITFLLYTLLMVLVLGFIMYVFMKRIAFSTSKTNKEMGKIYERLSLTIQDSYGKSSKSTIEVSEILKKYFCDIDKTLDEYSKEKALIILEIQNVLAKAEDVLKEAQDISKGQNELKKVSREICLKANNISQKAEEIYVKENKI